MEFINQIKAFATTPWGIVSIALFFGLILCIKFFSDKE